MSADEARTRWVLTPSNTEAELAAWREAYRLTVGPPPPGSVPLPVCAA